MPRSSGSDIMTRWPFRIMPHIPPFACKPSGTGAAGRNVPLETSISAAMMALLELRKNSSLLSALHLGAMPPSREI